jgi:hypothetical protein
MKTVYRLVILCFAATIAGCQTIPTGPVQDFAAATNALAQAESDYFDQIQAASDQSHELIASTLFVGHVGDFNKIAPELLKRDDFSKAKAVRVAAMAQLQSYSQQLSAIVGSSTGTWIADDVKSNTTNISKLLSDANAQSAAKIDAAEAGIIQTAVADLGTAIVNNASATEIRSLAQAARDPIEKIATMVKKDHDNIESDNFASGLVADQKQAMLNILHLVYEDRGANTVQRLTVVNAWRDWKPSLVTKGKDISDALAKLIKANEALAAKQEFSASQLSQQALALARQALGVSATGN